MVLSHSELQSPSKAHTAAPTPSLSSLTLAPSTVLTHTLQPPHWPPCHSSTTSVTAQLRAFASCSTAKISPRYPQGFLPHHLQIFSQIAPSQGVHSWPLLPKIVTPAHSLPHTPSSPFPGELFLLAQCFRFYTLTHLIISHPHLLEYKLQEENYFVVFIDAFVVPRIVLGT